MATGLFKETINKKDFGDDFTWGISSAAFQTEGAYNTDGKGLSIWDVFTTKKGKIHDNENAQVATDFYNKYPEDIDIIKQLGVRNFRFSVSWSRLLPDGTGYVNQKGLDYYRRVIDYCLENNIQPWITLYHWDLPQALQDKGGWINRDIVQWFSEYAQLCIRTFKDRVKYWMVLNEPMAFTGAGYFLGIHAPGKKGLKHFLPAVHHAALCQAQGGKIIRAEHPAAEIGTTFSCSYITPYAEEDAPAAKRMDALLNRLFIEPALGMGYPADDLPLLKKIEKYMQQGDDLAMKFDFDFTGIQNYTREVVRSAFYIPYLKARIISANKRKVFHTLMNWEVYPESIYEMIKKFSSYAGVKKVIVTENGAAFPDVVTGSKVNDAQRVNYLSAYLEQVLKAKKEGNKVEGYFVWSLTDNFEWAEGYRPRFGLVYIDFNNQLRIIKDSGYWYKDFLS